VPRRERRLELFKTVAGPVVALITKKENAQWRRSRGKHGGNDEIQREGQGAKSGNAAKHRIHIHADNFFKIDGLRIFLTFFIKFTSKLSTEIWIPPG
jgi:hypothetical protein